MSHSQEGVISLRDEILDLMGEARDSGMCPVCVARAAFAALAVPVASLDPNSWGPLLANLAQNTLNSLPDVRSQIAKQWAKTERPH